MGAHLSFPSVRGMRGAADAQARACASMSPVRLCTSSPSYDRISGALLSLIHACCISWIRAAFLCTGGSIFVPSPITISPFANQVCSSPAEQRRVQRACCLRARPPRTARSARPGASGASPRLSCLHTRRGAAPAPRALRVEMPRWLWLDFLGKVQEEVVVRTTGSSIGQSARVCKRSHSAVTIIAWIAITMVIVGEVNYYMSPQPTAEVGIDRTNIQSMEIDFTIRLPDLPCDNFGVDALDSSGAPSSVCFGPAIIDLTRSQVTCCLK